MNDKDFKDYLSGFFSEIAPVYDEMDPRFFNYFGRNFIDNINIKNGSTILDVASGKGAVTLNILKKHNDIKLFSIDLSYGMVQQLTGILSAGHYKNVEVMQMDAEFLSFSDNSFDYIFCGFGIFFFPDLKKAVSEISRVLKENGIFGFTTFRELQEHKLLEPVFKKYFPVDPDDRVAQNKHLFDSEEGLEKFLKENDLKKLKIINEKKEFTYPSREKWWEKQFTHGMKRRIEKLDQSRVAEFKEDCFRELEKVKVTNGYRLFVDVFFTFAQK